MKMTKIRAINHFLFLRRIDLKKIEFKLTDIEPHCESLDLGFISGDIFRKLTTKRVLYIV